MYCDSKRESILRSQFLCTLLIYLFIGFSFCFSRGGSVWAQNEKLNEEIAIAWQGFRNEIETAVVSGIAFRRGASWPHEYSPEEVETILNNYVTKTHVDFEELVASLLGISKTAAKKNYGSFEFKTDGHRKRTNLGIHSYVFDGDNDLIANRANGSVVMTRSESSAIRHTDIDFFRTIPAQRLANELQFVSRIQQTIVTRSTYADAELEPTTLFPRKLIFRNQNGDISRIVRQQGSVDNDANIIFPRTRVTESYRANVLYSLSVFKLDKVSLNVEVPKSEFEVQAAKGTGVFDYRKNVDRPRYKKVNKDHLDVAALSFEKPSGPSYWLYFMFAVVVLACVGAFGWIRMSKRAR